MKILLVDDDVECLKSIGKALSINGIPNEQFTDPAEAIESYKANEYDVVVTDMKMPGVSGFELVRTIRNYDSNVRIIIFTAFDDEHNREKAKRCGADLLLHKSVSFEDFLKVIHDDQPLQ